MARHHRNPTQPRGRDVGKTTWLVCPEGRDAGDAEEIVVDHQSVEGVLQHVADERRVVPGGGVRQAPVDDVAEQWLADLAAATS